MKASLRYGKKWLSGLAAEVADARPRGLAVGPAPSTYRTGRERREPPGDAQASPRPTDSAVLIPVAEPRTRDQDMTLPLRIRGEVPCAAMTDGPRTHRLPRARLSRHRASARGKRRRTSRATAAASG